MVDVGETTSGCMKFREAATEMKSSLPVRLGASRKLQVDRFLYSLQHCNGNGLERREPRTPRPKRAYPRSSITNLPSKRVDGMEPDLMKVEHSMRCCEALAVGSPLDEDLVVTVLTELRVPEIQERLRPPKTQTRSDTRFSQQQEPFSPRMVNRFISSVFSSRGLGGEKSPTMFKTLGARRGSHTREGSRGAGNDVKDRRREFDDKGSQQAGLESEWSVSFRAVCESRRYNRRPPSLEIH